MPYKNTLINHLLQLLMWKHINDNLNQRFRFDQHFQTYVAWSGLEARAWPWPGQAWPGNDQVALGPRQWLIWHVPEASCAPY